MSALAGGPTSSTRHLGCDGRAADLDAVAPDPAGQPGAPGSVGAPAICVVVPAFNEAATVGGVVVAARAAVPGAPVVVVDDASSDLTAEAAEQAGAIVVALPVNLGIGGAVQAGYRYAERHGFDVVVRMDGDGQHDALEVGRLVEPVLLGRADMTVGSRWLGRGNYTAGSSRRAGMRLLSTMVRWKTGQSFTDTTSGFRAIGRRSLALFARTYPSDFPEVESLVLAVREGLRVEEVPVRMTSRLHGKSSIAGTRSAYYMARVVVALAVDSLRRKERA